MIDDPESPATDQPTPSGSRPRRKTLRLRILIILTVLSLGLYGFVRLDRSVAKRLGRVAEAVHDLFNQEPGRPLPFTPEGSQLAEDIRALGGNPSIFIVKPGFFGTFGQVENYNVNFRTVQFDDAALAKLAEAHGDQLNGLDIENTGVTDAGLKSLARFTKLRHLTLRKFPQRIKPGETAPLSKITDAGLANLRGLDHLTTLNLDYLQITDAGLEAINDLPELLGLYLSRTKVEGKGLARLKSLPRLSILYLDGTPLAEDSLKALSGATNLQFLSVSGVHLSPDALPLFKAIPNLKQLDLTGCGFLDEEVDDLTSSKPGLKVIRR